MVLASACKFFPSYRSMNRGASKSGKTPSLVELMLTFRRLLAASPRPGEGGPGGRGGVLLRCSYKHPHRKLTGLEHKGGNSATPCRRVASSVGAPLTQNADHFATTQITSC